MGSSGPSNVLQEQINQAYEDSVKATIDNVNKKFFTEQLTISIYKENIKRLPQLMALLQNGDLHNLISEKLSDEDKERINNLFDKNESELEDLLPTLESLTAALNLIQESIQQTTDNQDFAHFNPMQKSWLLQLRPLAYSMVQNCKVAGHVSNIKQILYPPQMKIPGPRKITFFQRVLYVFSSKRKAEDDRKYLEHIRRDAARFANKYVEDGHLVEKLKEVVATTVAHTMNSWLDPAFLGLDKQMKLSTELAPLSLAETTNNKQVKSSTLSMVAHGAKAVVVDATKFSYGVGYDFAREKLGFNKIQEELIQDIEEIKNEDQLNDHIRIAFDKILRGETFDILVDFAKQMYAIQETAGRFDENHAEKLPEQFKNSLSSFGFKRLQDSPEFKKMLTNVLIELGVNFEKNDNTHNLLAKLYYMQPTALQKIRERFIEGIPDPNNFPRAKEFLFEEYQALSQDLDKHKGSENYFGLLSVQIRALEEVESKQRLGNISNILPNLDALIGVDTRIVAGLGFMDYVKKNARNLLQSRLPSLVNPLLNNVRKTRLEAQALSESYAQAMLATQTQRMNIKEKRNDSLKVEQTTVLEREAQWDKAFEEVTKERAKAKQPFQDNAALSHAQKLNQVVLKVFAKEWDKRALPIFKNIIPVMSHKLKDQMKTVLIKANASKELVQVFDKVFAPPDKNALSGLTHQELVDLQQAMSLCLKGMDFTKATADEKQFILLANNAVGNLGTSQIIPHAIAKIYDELLLNDRARLDSTNPGVLEKVISSYFSEKIALAMEDTFAGPSKLLEYYTKEKQGKNFVALDITAIHETKANSSSQGWGEYFLGLGKKAADKTGLSTAVGAIGTLAGYGVSAVSQTSIISYKTLAGWVSGKENTDNKTLNEIIIDNTHKAVKEQTFNAFFDMMQKMYALQETTKRFQKSFPAKNSEDNPFNKLGLGRLGVQHKDDKEHNFLEKVALSLGFLPKGNQPAIESLYYSMLVDKKEREKLCNAFCDPDNANSLIMLREAVLREYDSIQYRIKEGTLENSGNYVAMILAMNQILANVKIIYQATTAAQLYLPNMGDKLGVDHKSNSLYTNLMEQITKRGTESLATCGVAYMMQNEISQSIALTEEVLDGSKAALDKELEKRASQSSRHSLTPTLANQLQNTQEKPKNNGPTIEKENKSSRKP